jgi:hypothetical protein
MTTPYLICATLCYIKYALRIIDKEISHLDKRDNHYAFPKTKHTITKHSCNLYSYRID